MSAKQEIRIRFTGHYCRPAVRWMGRLVPILFVAFWISNLSASNARANGTVLTYIDLVHRLTDLEHLATLPPPGEETAQFSSYDRGSRYDETTGKYVHWDANGDNDGIIRKVGNQSVLAEITGPGCIWRIWSAAPNQGHVRIYLDGDTNPAVDLPFAEYFSGRQAPFTRPALVHIVSRGCNNYTPIPFQKSCKIVADENRGAYYHFGYSTFPSGTQVPAFKRELSPEENAALDEANNLLTGCGAFGAPFNSQGMRSMLNEAEFTEVRPGSQLEVKHDGPAAIVSIRVKFGNLPPRPADGDALRAITLEIYWDGEKTPSVWAPLGDFFGTAPGANSYSSWPCGLGSDGWWYCHWFMPFATNANVILRNENSFPIKIKLNTELQPLFAEATNYARFHAKWHRDELLPTEIERQIDWPLLKTAGRGRFVGVMLHVWNPHGGWWGEGDEKFFVDGEKFPSSFGTGSEDYFGYAWSDPALFQNAFHNQTHNDGNNRGQVSVNRWHIADQVPFQKQFEADIEKYFPNERPTRYAATAYWYLEPGGTDPYPPVPLEDRSNYYGQPAIERVPGAIEGESLKVISTTGGNVMEQDMAPFGGGWSNDAQLWWTGAKPGDKLELALPIEKSGRFRLRARLTKAVDYGIVLLSLDGEKLRGAIDLYHDGVVATGELELGSRELSAGNHILAVEIIGADPKAKKSFMFGLDYVKLVEVK